MIRAKQRYIKGHKGTQDAKEARKAQRQGNKETHRKARNSRKTMKQKKRRGVWNHSEIIARSNYNMDSFAIFE